MQQPGRDVCNVFDGLLERLFVGFRRLREAANFTDKLKRSGVNLVRSHGRIEIKERSDIATHGYLALRNQTSLPRLSRFTKRYEIAQRWIAQIQTKPQDCT